MPDKLRSCYCTLQVYALGFVPYIGKPLNFLLLSWMYAYYCFEYVILSMYFIGLHILLAFFLLFIWNFVGTNGTLLKLVWTRGWTFLNPIGHSLLALVMQLLIMILNMIHRGLNVSVRVCVGCACVNATSDHDT